MSEINKILVTGSSGAVGSRLCPYLQSKGLIVAGYDCRPSDGVPTAHVGDINDMSALTEAAESVDAIVHLAACSDDTASIEELMRSNVQGIHSVFEAARLKAVKRIVLASSLHAAGVPDQPEHLDTEARQPLTWYGSLKLWAEDVGRMYSRLHGMSVVAVRLGWYPRCRSELDEMRATHMGEMMYLSHNDANECLYRCVSVSGIQFALLYAVSRQGAKPMCDMECTKELIGWEPRDEFPDGVRFHDS